MFDIPVWSIGVGIILLFGGVGLALMQRLLRGERPANLFGGADHGELSVIVEDLQRQLSELEQAKQRISRLEHRVAAAERLLAGEKEVPRLGSRRD